MIEPFFFDHSRLFGSYSAGMGPNANTVVVICPPLFDEYRRTYRALSELAVAMAERGVHAFRFDYYGTADSQGLLSEATTGAWVSDIETAIDEAVAISGASQVVLLGVRFGATLAAQIDPRMVTSYLFWDPIVSGQQYLQWLHRVDEVLHQRHRIAALDNNLPCEDIAYNNFDLTPHLMSGIQELSIPGKTLYDPDLCFTVSTDPEFCQTFDQGNCVHPGITYDWPYYHHGVITHKPVLEALLERVQS